GYGPKTFALELDDKGKVVVHLVHMTTEPQIPPDASRDEAAPSGYRSAVIIESEKIIGNPAQRKGSVMLLAFDGFYWTDRDKYQMLPMGYGAPGRWAHLTGWHLYGLNSYTDETQIASLPPDNAYYPPDAMKVYMADGDGNRTVGDRSSGSLGTFIHEMGHSFGLHHPTPDDPRIVGDIMTIDYWSARGDFVPGRSDWCCLTADEAAILNKNPLFQVRKVGPPSTGAARSVGMRGAIDCVVRRDQFASIDFDGSGYRIARLATGQLSQSNRDYVWRNVPPSLEGYRFTQTAGGVAAKIVARAETGGRIYVSTAALHPPQLDSAGWHLIPLTLRYASADGKRTYPMYIYYKQVRPAERVPIPQCEWTGTIVIGP
ncbi:MAG TPA: hypothetical protein VG820_01105, partial [Fimbriimonadaceae bacterium]|nr:hypothetical protein [Fimbriimonadaceae bacterium]